MEEIHYLIGNSCNLNCDFCFWNARLPDMGLDFKKRIVNQIVRSGIKKVTVSGGEPLCAENFSEIMEYMHNNHLEVILHTNGLKIDKQTAEEIAPFISRVSLTLDGSNEETIMKMRKNSEIIEHTIFLIKLFNDLNVPVNIKTLITNVNREDILNIGEILKDLPIKYWSLLEFNPINRGQIHKDKYFIPSEQFDRICMQVKEKFSSMPIVTRKYGEMMQKYCFIAPNGKVYTYLNGPEDVLIGNLENDELSSIISKIESN